MPEIFLHEVATLTIIPHFSRWIQRTYGRIYLDLVAIT